MRERDCYSVSASKILALTPSCCSPDRSPPPLRQLDSILFSKGAEAPDSGATGGKSGRAREGGRNAVYGGGVPVVPLLLFCC